MGNTLYVVEYAAAVICMVLAPWTLIAFPVRWARRGYVGAARPYQPCTNLFSCEL